MIDRYSHIGKWHADTDGDNQDYICSGKYGKNSVITLADGVSSCKESKTGAKITADTVTNLFLKKGELLQEYSEQDIANMTLVEVLYELEQAAGSDNREIEDYSSTIASVLHDKKNKRLMCMSLGDSLIIGTSGEDCYVLTSPYDSRKGCCVTTTQGAETQTQIRIIDDAEIDSVIILSDGAWRPLFERGSMKKDIRSMLAAEDYEELKNYLTEQNGNDDYSFITMDITRKSGKALK